ncbi:hypothetical protein D3C81_1215710 [compost metagenome]
MGKEHIDLNQAGMMPCRNIDLSQQRDLRHTFRLLGSEPLHNIGIIMLKYPHLLVPEQLGLREPGLPLHPRFSENNRPNLIHLPTAGE